MNQNLTKQEVEQKVASLREAQMAMQDLLRQATDIMREIGGIEYDRSRMYWIAHIENALKDTEDGAMFPMGEILTDIENQINDVPTDDEDEW